MSTKDKSPIMYFDDEITLKGIKSYRVHKEKNTSFSQFRRFRLVDYNVKILMQNTILS